MTPDEARSHLWAIAHSDKLYPSFEREAARVAIAAIDRNVDLKRKHDYVNATNGLLVLVTRNARRRREWLVRYAWRQRGLARKRLVKTKDTR